MRTLPCPHVVDCSTQMALKAGNRIISSGTKVEQNCGKEGRQSSSGNEGGTNKILILLIVLIVMLGVGGALAFMKIMKKEKQ